MQSHANRGRLRICEVQKLGGVKLMTHGTHEVAWKLVFLIGTIVCFSPSCLVRTMDAFHNPNSRYLTASVFGSTIGSSRVL